MDYTFKLDLINILVFFLGFLAAYGRDLILKNTLKNNLTNLKEQFDRTTGEINKRDIRINKIDERVDGVDKEIVVIKTDYVNLKEIVIESKNWLSTEQIKINETLAETTFAIARLDATLQGMKAIFKQIIDSNSRKS